MSLPRLLRSTASGPPLAERSDDQLMLLAGAGVREAFAVLVARYALRLVQSCTRFTGSAESGRELAQETWVLAWKHRASFRRDTDLWLWLLGIARNRFRNQLRSRKVAARHAEATSFGASPSTEQVDALLLEERRAQVRRALAELPPAMREALLLRYGEELRYDEMGSLLGASESTLRSRVHHGLRALRDRLLGGKP